MAGFFSRYLSLKGGLNLVPKLNFDWFPRTSPDSTVSIPEIAMKPHSKHSDVLVTIDKVDPFELDHEFRKKGPLGVMIATLLQDSRNSLIRNRSPSFNKGK